MDVTEIKKYIDTEKALARIGGKTSLLKTLLTRFLTSTKPNYDQLQNDVAANNRESAARNVHAVKGVAGNLSMSALYDICPVFEAQLKSGADVSGALASFNAAYEKTAEFVNALIPTL